MSWSSSRGAAAWRGPWSPPGGFLPRFLRGPRGMVGGVGGEVVEVKFGGSGSSGCGTLHAFVRREEFSVVVVFLGGERGSSVFISGGWLQKGSDVVKGSLRRMGDGSTGLVVNSFIHDTAVMESRGVRHRSK